MITFWVLYFYETFVCYRGCLNLNCCMGKKVQKNVLMGIKILCVIGDVINKIATKGFCAEKFS